MKQRRVIVGEWSAAIFVIVTAAIVWLQVRVIGQNGVTVYDIFPLIGIIAFGIMWTHFVFGALREYYKLDQPKKDAYHNVSMWLVLAAIILHPGLLWYALWRDGFGLPPTSYLTVYDTQLFAILLGSISLAIFLSYELKRFFGNKKWWKYIEYVQVVGMGAIFVHAIQLGGELEVSWFRVIWWFYFVTLVGAVGYSYYNKIRKIKERV